MLADNIIFLKKQFPNFYETIKAWEDKTLEPAFFIETTRDGNQTIKGNYDDQQIFIHSKYNPIREAELVIDKLEEKVQITDDTHVIFYGLGLGYHIEVFNRRYPNSQFSIVEPSVEVMSQYLDNKKLKHLLLKNLISIHAGTECGDLFYKLKQRKDSHLVICELPVYPKLFSNDYSRFLSDFKNALKEEKFLIATNLSAEKIWIHNCVNNFKAVLNTPNILAEHQGIFSDKPAILVAAGPSLDFEIENLRKIKDDGLAFIFSVGSAINTLVLHGIYPDVMCTYDPFTANQQVFKKINELEINTIPMVFGSSVGYETLEQYHGPKYHMITNHDSVANYFLKLENNQEIKIVHDAPSIAIVTLELLSKLGVGKIALVGQNLAYLNDKHYADGIGYAPEKSLKTVEIEDVEGNSVETTDVFLSMKKSIEIVIKQVESVVINTTRGGANIEGTIYKPLEELIDEDLGTQVVAENDFTNITQKMKYDKTYMVEQFIKMETAYNTYVEILKEIKAYINRLKRLLNTKNKQEIIDTQIRMNYQVSRMEDNDFFKAFAMNMNRVQYQLVIDNKLESKNEKNEIVGIRNNVKSLENFIDNLYSEKKINEDIIKILSNVILE